MKKLGIYMVIISFSFLIGLHNSEATRNDYYKTYEVTQITGDSLTLSDSDGNIIEVNKDPKDHKVGYNVRYDRIRNRLRSARWQDYRVVGVSDATITLQHKTGDSITVKGNYRGKYDMGDQVSYDSIDNKLKENPPQ